jgi:hypothetical protein
VVVPAVRVRRHDLAGRGPVATAAPRRAAPGAKRRLGSPLQPRRHLDARQVGVPLVRVLGPGLPHAAVRARRPGVRDGPADPVHARVVHAPERAAARLRVRPVRRQPTGARLGGLARVQNRGPGRRARHALFGPRVPEAAAQLHVVGEPQGHRRAQPLLGRIPGAGQHRRLRPVVASGERQLSGAGRRHRLDRVLLPHDAVDGAGAGADRPGVRRHGVQVLRALRADRRRHQQLRRQRPVGRGGRLLLRPAARRRK